MRSRLHLAVALLLLPFLLSVIMVRRPEPIYTVYFNDQLPWGTAESGSGTTVCTTHGATSTNVWPLQYCEATNHAAAEGDGYLRMIGQNPPPLDKSWTDWNAVFADRTEIWVEGYLYINTGTASAATYALELTNNGASIGGIYGFSVTSTFGIGILTCDGTFAAGGMHYLEDTWLHFLLYVDIVNGDMTFYCDDHNGMQTAFGSCNGTGGDGGTPINGFTTSGSIQVLETGLDKLRFYDRDPRIRQ